MSVTSHAAEDYKLALRWDAPATKSVRIVDQDAQRTEHFGQQSLAVPAPTLAAGATLELRITGD